MPDSLFNLFTKEYSADPFLYYKQIRESHPVCEIVPGGIWLISRYEDVKFALQRHDIFSSEGNTQILQPEWLKRHYLPKYILAEDPPIHNYHRSILPRLFFDKVIDELKPTMQQEASLLIAAMKENPAPELLSDFSHPYFGKIAQLLTGLDDKDIQYAYNWITLFMHLPEQPSEGFLVHLDNTYECFQEVLLKAATSTKKPRTQLQQLLQRNIKENKQTLEQACATLEIIIFGLCSTPVNFMSHLYINLSNYPHVKAHLDRDKTLIPAFIEESLRFDNSEHILVRTTTTAIERSNTTIPAGAITYLLLASANRDPEQFENPDLFNIHRDTRSHLGFGYGPHHCIGMKLLRTAGQIAIETLLAEFQKIDCSDNQAKPWSHSLTSHNVNKIPMILE